MVRLLFVIWVGLVGVRCLSATEVLPAFSLLALTVENDEIWEVEPVLFDPSWEMYGKEIYSTSWMRVRLTAVYRSAEEWERLLGN